MIVAGALAGAVVGVVAGVIALPPAVALSPAVSLSRAVSRSSAVSLAAPAVSSATPAGPTSVVTVRDPRVAESSGLVISPTHPDLAWTVNDSGSRATVYGVSTRTGRTRAVLSLRDTDARDMEAMTATTDGGRGLLWVGDVGDNRRVRDSVVLRVVREPRTLGSRGHTTVVTPASLRVRYPGGPADVETMLWTPDGRLLLVTKELLSAAVLEVPRQAVRDALAGRSTSIPVVAQQVATVSQTLVTDGAVLPDGRIVLRGYGGAVVYEPVGDGGTLQSLAALDLPAQPQGETLAVEPGGSSVLVGSEGLRQKLWRVPVPSAERSAAQHSTAQPSTADPSPSDPSPAGPSKAGASTVENPSSATDAARLASVDRSAPAGRTAWWAAAGAVLAAVLVAFTAARRRGRRTR